MTYANPAWQAYNSDLTHITDEGKAIGPLIAINCGHFIQKDSPKFVSEELISLLDRVVNGVEQVSERVSKHTRVILCLACANSLFRHLRSEERWFATAQTMGSPSRTTTTTHTMVAKYDICT